MEEDIKDLEKYISFASKEENFSHNADWKWHKDLATKIQNLIARNKELETIVKTYNAIPNDYISNDVKIVIADREYFNNGILKENIIPKSKVKEKIEELKNGTYDAKIILQQLLED